MSDHDPDESIEIEIMMSDLVPETQAKVLAALGLKSAEEGNYDVFPLFVLELYPDRNDQ